MHQRIAARRLCQPLRQPGHQQWRRRRRYCRVEGQQACLLRRTDQVKRADRGRGVIDNPLQQHQQLFEQTLHAGSAVAVGQKIERQCLAFTLRRQLHLQHQFTAISALRHLLQAPPRRGVDAVLTHSGKTQGGQRLVRRRRPVLLPGHVLRRQRGERAHPRIEALAFINTHLHRQGLFQHAGALGKVVIVLAAVMAPLSEESGLVADPPQQRPPGGLQQGWHCHLQCGGPALQAGLQRRVECDLHPLHRRSTAVAEAIRQPGMAARLTLKMIVPVTLGLPGILVDGRFRTPLQVLLEAPGRLVLACIRCPVQGNQPFGQQAHARAIDQHAGHRQGQLPMRLVQAQQQGLRPGALGQGERRVQPGLALLLKRLGRQRRQVRGQCQWRAVGARAPAQAVEARHRLQPRGQLGVQLGQRGHGAL